MEIKELNSKINVLSREFLKLEEEQKENLKFIQEQQKKILEKVREDEKERDLLNNKLEKVGSFEKKLSTVNLINKFFVGVIVLLISVLGYLTWELHSLKKIEIERNIEISKILLGKKQYWYDPKDFNLYSRPTKDLKKEKKK